MRSQSGNKKLWFGQTRGTDLNGLGGPNPFAIAIAQPRFWVYFDPTWDCRILGHDNYEAFFEDTVRGVQKGIEEAKAAAAKRPSDPYAGSKK